MRKQWFWTLTAICVVLILSGGAFLMLRNQKHQRVKQRYDTYMAQLDTMMLPKITDEDTEYDVNSDKAEEAKNYLMKHAPHLLISEEPDDPSKVHLERLRKVDPDAAAKLEAQFAQIDRENEAWLAKVKSGNYSYKEYIAYLRSVDPESAAELEADLAQVDREYEANIAAIDAELEAFEQEYRHHKADMVAFEKRREVSRQDRLAFEREAGESRARLDKFIDELRSHLIVDENGKLLGIKESSIFNEMRTESGSSNEIENPTLPIDVHKESADSENSVKEISETSTAMTDWQQTLTREMTRLDAGFYEKYPDVAIRPLLSDVEFERLFPSQAERNELQKRTKTLQSTYAKEINTLLQRMPREKRNVLLKLVQEGLTCQWDRDFADSVLKQLQRTDQ